MYSSSSSNYYAAFSKPYCSLTENCNAIIMPSIPNRFLLFVFITGDGNQENG